MAKYNADMGPVKRAILFIPVIAKCVKKNPTGIPLIALAIISTRIYHKMIRYVAIKTFSVTTIIGR